ncbi:zinc finger BED domain-containing protein 5 [Trichonephila clavipes]|nr:zinc finger BED domain-containing protein 5 [Trichonephila clavipes]
MRDSKSDMKTESAESGFYYKSKYLILNLYYTSRHKMSDYTILKNTMEQIRQLKITNGGCDKLLSDPELGKMTVQYKKESMERLETFEVDDEFFSRKTKAFGILLPFSPSYLCETGFSAVAALQTKYRTQLNIDKELSVSISSIKPSFEKLNSERQAHGSH